MTASIGTLPPLTLAQAVQRVNELKATVSASRYANFLKCPPGLTGLAQDLALYDDGIFSAEQTLQSMRDRLGIVVTPESLEFARLQQALYLGHFHDRASDSEAGECNGR